MHEEGQRSYTAYLDDPLVDGLATESQLRFACSVSSKTNGFYMYMAKVTIKGSIHARQCGHRDFSETGTRGEESEIVGRFGISPMKTIVTAKVILAVIYAQPLCAS